MKRIFFIFCTLVLALNTNAQEAACMNPDVNCDGAVAVDDLLGLLSFFGEVDIDNDGVWDSQDDCIDDGCGVCNGPGPQVLVIDTVTVVLDSLYINELDTWYVYEVADTSFTFVCSNPGCTNPEALNYDPYASEDDGSCYGNGPAECEFLESLTYHGYDYELIVIGGQCLFAENLRTEYYSNGDTIPVLSDSEWVSTNSGAQAVYNGNMLGYGRLYNWFAVDDSRGLCPSGWHVPSEIEWTEMIATVESPQGNSLKSTTGWDAYAGCVNPCLTSTSCCPNGTNSSGFNGMPGGFRFGTGSGAYHSEGEAGLWWSSTSYGGSAWYWTLINYMEGVNWQSPQNKREGFSVRCVLNSGDYCVEDECGVCNGPGPQVLAIDSITTTSDSIFVEAINEWYVFEVPDTTFTLVCTNPGCTDPTADNYDPYASEDDGSCFIGNPCANELTVTFDDYTYDLVQIGGQCWFAENLRTEHYTNGDAIPANLSDGEWSSATSGAVAVYGEDEGCNNSSPDGDACDPAWSLNEYGRLYNWYAVDDARGLCPTGWHVPTDGEWMTLETELGMSESDANSTGGRGTDQGTQMKTTYGWNGIDNGTNSSGFSGFPGGSRLSSGFFNYAGYFGRWWSSSPSGSNAWSRYLDSDWSDVYRVESGLRYGYSVRCLKDAE